MPNMHHNSLDNLKQKSSSPCIILLTIYNPSNAPLHIHNASFISNSYPFSRPSNLRGVCSTRTTVAALCLLTSFHHSIIVFCIQWALMTFNIILVFEFKESPREKISHGLFSHSFVVLVNGCPEHQSVLFNKSFQRRDYSVWLLLFIFPWLSHMLRSYFRITSASPNMFDYNYTELSK